MRTTSSNSSVCQLVFQFLLLFEIFCRASFLRINWRTTAANNNLVNDDASAAVDDDFYGRMNEKLAQITDYAQNAYDRSPVLRSAFDASMAANANVVQQQLNKLHSAESFNEIPPPPSHSRRRRRHQQQHQQQQYEQGNGGDSGTPNTAVRWLTDSLHLKHTAPYCCDNDNGDDDHRHQSVSYNDAATAAAFSPISSDKKDNHKIDEQHQLQQQQQRYSTNIETSGGRRNLNAKQLDWASQNRCKFKRFLAEIRHVYDGNDDDDKWRRRRRQMDHYQGILYIYGYL